jgi:hypothetical protein
MLQPDLLERTIEVLEDVDRLRKKLMRQGEISLAKPSSCLFVATASAVVL